MESKDEVHAEGRRYSVYLIGGIRSNDYFTYYANTNYHYLFKIITFLVGFYVSTMATRWWEQVLWLSKGKENKFYSPKVKGIPTPANINLQLGSVVKMADSEALTFKKKIMRYIHLRLAKDLRNLRNNNNNNNRLFSVGLW